MRSEGTLLSLGFILLLDGSNQSSETSHALMMRVFLHQMGDVTAKSWSHTQNSTHSLDRHTGGSIGSDASRDCMDLWLVRTNKASNIVGALIRTENLNDRLLYFEGNFTKPRQSALLRNHIHAPSMLATPLKLSRRGPTL